MVEQTHVEAENVKEKVPALRFSEEVFYMLRILNNKLRECEAYRKHEDFICSQVLGLAFANQLQKVAANAEIYLYPYLAKARMLSYTEQQMKEVHRTNIANAFATLGCAFTGAEAFPNAPNRGNVKDHVQAVNAELLDLHGPKRELLERLLSYGKEVTGILSYKNFEQQMLHNLEQQDTHLVLSKKFLGELLLLLQGNPEIYVL